MDGKHYDYLIVGAGLFGAVFAYEAIKRGKKCLVVEKRKHIGGNVYCEQKDGIRIHKYGAHIFHTSNEKVWKYINQFTRFNNYVNSPVANYQGKLYNLPFNMNTFYQMWGCVTPQEVEEKIAEQRKEIQGEPQNLEEQAISLVGRDIYEKLIKGYTEKQWGKSCTELPAFIIRRLPVRYRFDNNYFNDLYQGIPVDGYNAIIAKMLEKVEVKLECDFNENQEMFKSIADRIVYTGAVDEYFKYKVGELEYRGLRFDTEKIEVDNYQGVAVMNFTERKIPYTRIIEHKHFEFGNQLVTYITKEYPTDWQRGQEAYYPVNDEKNQRLYAEYKVMADNEPDVIFGGRLAEYRYYNMDQVIASALDAVEKEFGK